jgi:hypothetical protein
LSFTAHSAPGTDKELSMSALISPQEAELHPKYRYPRSTSAKDRLNGNGPRYVKRGHRVFYDTADLDAWLESLKRASTSEYAR